MTARTEWNSRPSQHVDALAHRLNEVYGLIQAHRHTIALLQREQYALEHGLRSAGWAPPNLPEVPLPPEVPACPR
jgi:hypothetical protein